MGEHRSQIQISLREGAAVLHILVDQEIELGRRLGRLGPWLARV
jgi:hypothetical protein